jgi:hypothetical protein
MGQLCRPQSSWESEIREKVSNALNEGSFMDRLAW